MIIKTLFPSAITLHRPWPPILISHLFYPGLFLVLGRSFFTVRVFLVEIYIYSVAKITNPKECVYDILDFSLLHNIIIGNYIIISLLHNIIIIIIMKRKGV